MKGFLSALLFVLAFSAPAWSRDNIYVVNVDDNLVSVIDGDEEAVAREIPVGVEPCDIAVNPSGELVAVSTGGSRGEVWLLNGKSLEVQKKVLLAEESEGRKTNCFFLAFDSDGRRLYAVNQFSLVLYVLDTSEGSVAKKLKLGKKEGQRTGRGIVLSPDGSRLYVPVDNGSEIFTVNVKNLKYDSISVEGMPTAIAVSPDGGVLYVADSENSSLNILNLKTGKVTRRVPVGNYPAAVAVSKDGRHIFVSNLHSYSVTVIDAVSLVAAANVPVGAYSACVAVSADNKRVYVCNYNEKSVSIIDADSYTELARVITAYTPVKIIINRSPQ